MKVMERFGREARRSSMAAAATDGLSGCRERMSSKRRRREESAGSMEEEDCKVEVEDNMVLSQMSSSSSARRRNHMVMSGSKKDQPLEVIGARVPRKARSASGKRLHESSSSGNDGIGKDHNLQKQHVEARKKMKSTGIKNRPPKSSKLSSGPVEEDIENEIAEVLFGLMKHVDSVKSSTSNRDDEDKDRYSIRKDSKISISEQEPTHASDPELKNVSKENNSIAEAVEVESNQQPKMGTSSPNCEPESGSVSGPLELQKEEAKPFVEESVGGEVPELERKRDDKFGFDLMAPPPMEDSASDTVAEAELETLQDKTIEVVNEKLSLNSNQDSGTKTEEQPKAITPKLERSDWRSGLSATTSQPGNSLLPQPCAKRCATHHYIARNIYLDQKVTRTKNLSPPPAYSKPDIVIVNELLGSVSGHSAKESKDQRSEAAFVEASKSKKPVAYQSPSQPASAGNLMCGSTFTFSLGQNQASVAAASDPSGPLKYTEVTNNASHFSHSALSKAAAAKASSLNVTFQEGPYMAIKGYSFPMATPSGTTLAFQGDNSTQAVPLYNGPFYSNQMFRPPQLHHQKPQSQFQLQVQSNHQKNMGMPTDSSSSQRQLESQQLQKTQFISMQSQQPQKKYVTQSLRSCKVENDIIGGHTATSSQAQHSVYGYGKNFAVPLQPMNFAMLPYATMSGGSSKNHIGQEQQQDFKGVFGMSFGSITGNEGTGTLLNFSSMPQNPAMYQNLQGANQKHHHQVSERKNGGNSDNPAHDKSKAATGRSSSTVAQTLVFDNSPTNLNFTTLNSHPQHLYQFQLQQQQPGTVAWSKAPKTAPVLSQSLIQCSTSVQSHSNSGRSLSSQVPINTSTVNSFLQQQGRASQGPTQISFEGNPKSSLTVTQGQHNNPSLLTT
ncbi:protein TIME FOR COFFEE-like [Argentina anserina]|uniref:protein TIME FOR COFFEE-like n=1 Tax=Argentina anserina TaxID=57926 RepID=UPI00217651ED|nr:protein TIME FOR COFFEE-like [Potentilla anserina]XP_050366302.1 protein TIME FOR COFFEE-like [Potentilla anserina]